MKNKVQFIIFLLFGLTFLVYLFPYVFVEAAKLESGVTIKGPSTTETEKICDDTIDNDNDGKIDATDEDCVAAPASPTVYSCGPLKLYGVPINYGQVNPGQVIKRTIVVGPEKAQGIIARIMISGGDWISDAPGNPTVSGPEITQVSDNSEGPWTALKSNAFQVGRVPIGATVGVFFKLNVPANGLSGLLHQEITIDLRC